MIFTGLWIIAHECGHGAFSNINTLNDVVGLAVHSFLLVPFFSWKISHKNHHKNIASIEHDEVFVPARRRTFNAKEMIEETPLYSAYNLFLFVVFGWFIGYLIKNMGGPEKYWNSKIRNHFNPNSVLFKPNEYWLVVISTVGVAITMAVLITLGYHYGFTALLVYYFVPYMIVHAHIVIITYENHTDVYLPHYDEKSWNWLIGSLSTVDRSWGPVLDHFFHHIADTHVAHHLFSKMPFYRAQEATIHIKRVLGKHYRSDDTPILAALWRIFRNCKFIENEDSVAHYRKDWKQPNA